MSSSPEKDSNSGSDRTEMLYTLEEAANVWNVSVDDLKRRISDGTIQGVQKGDRLLILHEEMKKIGDDPSAAPSLADLPEWEVNGSAKLVVPSSGEEEKKESEGKRAKDPFDEIVEELKNRKNKVKEWIGRFFKVVERSRRKEVEEEVAQRKVSLKLGLMTGRNELSCDFCEVNDRFYLGALFADIYVDGQLKWVMCPNCLWYCREQSKGSLENNVRARFNHLAHRLEQEARRARSLAASEDIRVPGNHEWEAWETASYALKEAASTIDEEGRE